MTVSGTYSRDIRLLPIDRFSDTKAFDQVRVGRAQNYLEPEHVNQIFNWYQSFANVENYVKVASIDDLKERPEVFSVNWFRMDADGRFVWPGFGQNMRVLKWIVERCNGTASAKKTPVGWVPDYADLEWKGLSNFTAENFESVISMEREDWVKELASHDELFASLRPRVPKELEARLDMLKRTMTS